MALLHRATLRPTKLDLLTAWLPGRQWFTGPAGVEVVSRGAYRFDDPAGEVGIETMLVGAADGPVHQVPLTYRANPLDGAEDWLVGTTEHSVLGPRWVYDGCADPVYAAALAHAILAGSGQADEYFEVDGRREVREPTMTVVATESGNDNPPSVGALRRVVDQDSTLISTDTVEMVVVRRPGVGADGATGATLIGTWDGQPTSVPLAYARVR
ncbi:CG0192-related protein [Micromonospora sp. CPCC 205558]|uniref:CG0192-related protein n=1 Tax=Micromonospora sp. CPCC 205558 TaxID=3122403 RepID=UPI002FEF3B63